MKDIVIITNFCASLSKSANSRFTYIADMLYKNNDVEIVSSGFSHDDKKKRVCDYSKFPNYKITLVDEPGYKKNISILRFVSHHVWGKKVYKYIKSRRKPDLIYCAIPSLTVAAKVGAFCQKNGIRFIIDVQDLWPEAFQMVFNVPFISKMLFFPFKKMADKSYSFANEIIAVSQTYADRALRVNNICKDAHVVFLGTNLDTYDSSSMDNTVSKPLGEIWVAYCGTLGSSYDITCVIDAISILQIRGYANIKFVIMGDGPRKEEFEKYASNKKIKAQFLGSLPYPRMCGILSACDIVVNPITHGAAQSIINKHADYAASGLPVVNTQECIEYRNLIDEYNMGFNCNNNDAKDMAEKLAKLIDNKELRIQMGKNARRCAEEKFDRRYSYQEIVRAIYGN